MSEPQTTAPGPHDGRHEAVRPKGAGPWRTLFIILAVLLVLAIIGLLLWIFVFSKGGGGGTPTNTPTQTATTTPTQTVSPPPLTACAPNDLSLQLGTPVAQGAGLTTVDILFENTGASECTIEGYPAVIMYWADGSPLGDVSTNDTTTPPTQVTLQPGATASVVLSVEAAGNACDAPVDAAGFDVTIEGASSPVQLPATGFQGCSDPGTELLKVSAYSAN